MRTQLIAAVIFLFSSLSTWAQPNSSSCFLLNLNKGSQLFLQGEKHYQEAQQAFEKAIVKKSKETDLSNYVLARLSQYQVIKKNYAEAIQLLEQSIKKGAKWKTISYLYQNAPTFTATKEWKALEERYDELHGYWMVHNFDLDYYTVITQMDAFEQFFVKKMVDYDAENAEQMKEIRTNIIKENTKQTKQLIEEKGYPNMDAIGLDAAFSYLIIIVHSGQVDSTTWTYFEPILKEQLVIGNISPNFYAQTIDSWRNSFDLPSIYGHTHTKTGYKPIKNIKEIDHRRLSIALPPLAERAKKLNKKLPTDYQVLSDKEIAKYYQYCD